jgi:uncharacterized protein (DUF2252 family)
MTTPKSAKSTTPARGSGSTRAAGAASKTGRGSTGAARTGDTASKATAAGKTAAAGRTSTAGKTSTAGRTTAARRPSAASRTGTASRASTVSRTVVRASGRPSARSREAEPEHLAPAERAARGKALRASVPRESHAEFSPKPDRDPIALLEEQARTRLPQLIPVRYGRMLVSPFSYYRGAALPMAADLASTPVTGLRVQACGDAHLTNFGLFGSPERNLLFDLNDFDETLPGPWEWDVKRLAASLEVAARDNGFGRKDRKAIVAGTVAAYRNAMRVFAEQGSLAVWYARADVREIRQQFETQMGARQRATIDKAMAKAQTRDSMQALAKLTAVKDGRLRILADPPLVVPVDDLLPDDVTRSEFVDQIKSLIASYRRTLQHDRRILLEQFAFTDMAHKVVGVGSVGTRCWIVLMLGRDQNDPLFLQVKEAQPSVLARFAGASKQSNQGERVVAGQRLMQAVSDIFLGWQRVIGMDGRRRDFYIRQLRDWKFSLETSAMVPRGMRLYGALCGWTLARAHARTGDRIAIAAYLGNSTAFDQAVAQFASAYADQNERDHVALAQAASAGRIEIQNI